MGLCLCMNIKYCKWRGRIGHVSNEEWDSKSDFKGNVDPSTAYKNVFYLKIIQKYSDSAERSSVLILGRRGVTVRAPALKPHGTKGADTKSTPC